MAEWIRSFDRSLWYIKQFPDEIRIASASGFFRAERKRWEIGVLRGNWQQHLLDQRRVPQGIANDENLMQGQEVLWKLTGAGIHCGSGLTWGGRGSTARVYSFQIPYSAIAIPMTLLSVWLLLSKPRKSESSPVGIR